jgi:hypothetical protein
MSKLGDKLWEIYKYGRKNKLHSFTGYNNFYNAEYKKYKNKKAKSIHPFDITFEQWVLLWDLDLLYNYNSRYKKKMICRIKEPGPYSIDNVYIGDPIDNSHDCIRNGNHSNAIYNPLKHTRGFKSS